MALRAVSRLRGALVWVLRARAGAWQARGAAGSGVDELRAEPDRFGGLWVRLAARPPVDPAAFRSRLQGKWGRGRTGLLARPGQARRQGVSTGPAPRLICRDTPAPTPGTLPHSEPTHSARPGLADLAALVVDRFDCCRDQAWAVLAGSHAEGLVL